MRGELDDDPLQAASRTIIVIVWIVGAAVVALFGLGILLATGVL